LRVAKKLFVLLIDPDQSYKKQVVQYLSNHFQILLADNLHEGFMLISRHRPQVVLMELNQKDGDSLKWIESIRAYPWSAQIAIACVTTKNGVRDKISGFRAGADDFLVKPLDMDMLLPRVILLMRYRMC
jgi:DNA-binding response OmpR family regulator